MPSIVSRRAVGYVCFVKGTSTTEIYTLSLHTLFRSWCRSGSRATGAGSWAATRCGRSRPRRVWRCPRTMPPARSRRRSEEHTSELQSRENLVCRLLLEKKKKREKDYVRDHQMNP